MKFWNCGAEGQVLIGGLGAVTVMYFLGGKVAYPVLILLMIAASIIAGVIWAIIPALFEAQWDTNETLFTLMMNYIATQLVAFCLKAWVKSGSGVLAPMEQYGLPKIGHRYMLNIIIVLALTVGMYIYLKYSKQGYEISVVGESVKTAKYIGINVKKVIIRTMLVSGAVCGIAGLLLVGGTDHTITTTTVGGRGFTAIMVSWLAKFDPFVMVLTTFLVVFLQKGSSQMQYDFGVNSSVSDIITAIILFFIIGCEFFINYRIVFRKKETTAVKEAEQK
jgi:simple sugar transport system permease protein